MADQVKSTALFSSVYTGLIGVEKTKRGLGKTFHAAVIQLLNENPTATADELVTIFLEALTEVENTLREELTKAFGDDADPKVEMPNWRQYKSDYKRALELVHRSDLMKCGGVKDVKDKLQAVRDAMKEKKNGAVSTDTGAGSTANESASGGSTSSVATSAGSKLSPKLQSLLDEYAAALAQIPEDKAAEVLSKSRDIAWSILRKGKKFAGVTTSGANKAAA